MPLQPIFADVLALIPQVGDSSIKPTIQFISQDKPLCIALGTIAQGQIGLSAIYDLLKIFCPILSLGQEKIVQSSLALFPIDGRVTILTSSAPNL